MEGALLMLKRQLDKSCCHIKFQPTARSGIHNRFYFQNDRQSPCLQPLQNSSPNPLTPALFQYSKMLHKQAARQLPVKYQRHNLPVTIDLHTFKPRPGCHGTPVLSP